MVMTREEFAAFVTPAQLEFVLTSIQRGWADYADEANYSAAARLAHHRAVRSQIRNAHILHRAECMLRDCPGMGVRLATKHGRPLFFINERARLSFKKLNKNLRHSNYPTWQARAFDAQLWPADILTATGQDALATSLWPADVLPPAVNVVGGYLPNASETEFTVYIICPDGEGNAWEWPLTGADIVELIAAHAPSQTHAASKIRKRSVTVRPGAIRKKPAGGAAQ